MSFTRAALMLVCCFVFPCLTVAETSDLGGYPDRFKGDGDKEPPRCQFDIPSLAEEPFFIKWSCLDNECAQDEIRSELWMLRKGEQAPIKVKEFLGFPASVFIDEALLEQQVFTNGLPVSFRLVATDRAGVSMISPFISVGAGSSRKDTCRLEVTRLATTSTATTTGTPEMSVLVQKADASSTQLTATSVLVNTPTEVEANPCEIDEICENDSMVKFSAVVSQTQDSSVSGTVTITPGNIKVSVSGETGERTEGLSSFDLSGTSTLEDSSTVEVSLSCEKSGS